MTHILAHDPARELPIYQAGQRAGGDIGLCIALDAICSVMARQEDAAIIAALDIRQPGSAIHEYTAGRLGAVAQTVAGAFRNATR